MRNSYGRIAVLGPAVCALLALGIATPAAGQFGGLKKKLKAEAGQEAAAEGAKATGVSPAPTNAPATPATQAATGPTGGSVVLTPEVVDHMLAGLKAAEAYRQAARKEDTPYGRYIKASEAYEAATVKCQAAQQPFINRMASDEKLSNQYSELMNKMTDALGKGDREAAMKYQDQALALQDPSCTVKEPTRPDDYYDAQRTVDAKAEQAGVKGSGLSASEYAMALERGQGILRNNPPPDASASEQSAVNAKAEQAGVKGSGLSASEYAMALERGEGILRNNPPPDASASEQGAVNAKAAELKPLMNIHDQPAQRAMKPAAAPAPTPAPPPGADTVPPGAAAMNDCMVKNAQKHEKELTALGERAEAAQKAGDMAKTMAIADTMRQLQMAGCSAGQ